VRPRPFTVAILAILPIYGIMIIILIFILIDWVKPCPITYYDNES
jgi:phosphatidylglycerophosphatase A